MSSKTTITSSFKKLQDYICNTLETADGAGKFSEDTWKRPGGGGGRTRVLSNGGIIEKGGVNFSAVHGKLSPAIQKKLNIGRKNFYATGVSIVMHPHSPMVPIIHMNVRYFELDSKDWWFGGGIDLTPHYINKEDVKFFHTSLKNTCNHFHPEFYSRFSKWADEYFYIKHRKETRGAGGIFFDRITSSAGLPKEKLFEFVMAVGHLFPEVYIALIRKNKQLPYGEKEKQWQLLRRGRYAEFNLVYDAGTRFGLETDGRTESILMSLPPRADWAYNFQPLKGSREADTLQFLQTKKRNYFR